jgi:glycyl-tRNA synthetase (class II)
MNLAKQTKHDNAELDPNIIKAIDDYITVVQKFLDDNVYSQSDIYQVFIQQTSQDNANAFNALPEKTQSDKDKKAKIQKAFLASLTKLQKNNNQLDFDENGKPYGNYIPYVVETSVGADRLFLATFCNAFTKETIPSNEEGKEDKERTYLKLHPALAPIKAAVLPLVKKDGLAEKAEAIASSLKSSFRTVYDDGGAIGKRYTRQDLIGTPFCIAVDYQTMEDDTVTIRHRDSMTQERVSISVLKEKIGYAVSMERILEAI